MNTTILDIVKSFKTGSRAKNLNFKDFLAYVYETFEIKINSEEFKEG